VKNPAFSPEKNEKTQASGEELAQRAEQEQMCLGVGGFHGFWEMVVSIVMEVPQKRCMVYSGKSYL